jgi:hypothetical protein
VTHYNFSPFLPGEGVIPHADQTVGYIRVRFPGGAELALFVSVSTRALNQPCVIIGNGGRVFPHRQSDRSVKLTTSI